MEQPRLFHRKKVRSERGPQSVFSRYTPWEKRFQLICAQGANSWRRAGKFAPEALFAPFVSYFWKVEGAMVR